MTILCAPLLGYKAFEPPEALNEIPSYLIPILP